MISAVPYAVQNGSHSASLFRQATSSLVPNGGGPVQSGDLAVTQTGTPSMGVVVGVGRAWVPGTNVANFSGTTYSSQAQYFALNDAAVTLTIAAADPTNPRIDIVCLTVNDAQYAGSTNNAVLQVITGTPAASPTAPTAPANTLVLANVSVAANATSITNSNITQQAVNGVVPAQKVPKVWANTTIAGSSTGLLTNLQSGTIVPIIQGGTTVAAPDVNGYFSIAFPQAFPNGLITVIPVCGDNSITNGQRIIITLGTATANTTQANYRAWDDAANAAYGSSNGSALLRVDWIAVGW